MWLVAFIDDSASNKLDERLFMAGYMHLASDWPKFCLEWTEELGSFPRIDYLKMSEANSMSGEFEGWSIIDRNAKINRFIKIIQKSSPLLSFHCSIGRKSMREKLKEVAPRPLSNSYFSCTFQIISTLSRYLLSIGNKTKIKFLFDNQGDIEKDIYLFSQRMMDSLSKNASDLIFDVCHASDRDFVQLQAADMLAWHVRKEHELFQKVGKLPAANLLRSAQHLYSEIDEEIVTKWGRQISGIQGADQLKTLSQWRSFRKSAATSAAKIPQAEN